MVVSDTLTISASCFFGSRASSRKIFFYYFDKFWRNCFQASARLRDVLKGHLYLIVVTDKSRHKLMTSHSLWSLQIFSAW